MNFSGSGEFPAAIVSIKCKVRIPKTGSLLSRRVSVTFAIRSKLSVRSVGVQSRDDVSFTYITVAF